MLWLLGGCSGSSSGSTGGKGVPFRIVGTITNAGSDSLFLMDYVGFDMVKLAALKIDKTGEAKFELTGTVPAPGIYALALDQNRRVDLALGYEEEVKLTTEGTAFYANLKFEGNTINTELYEYLKSLSVIQQQINKANQDYQLAANSGNNDLLKVRETELNQLFEQQSDLQSTYVSKKGPIGTLARLQRFVPYSKATDKANYKNDLDYFIKTFISENDLKDTANGYFPVFYEKTGQYFQQLWYMTQDYGVIAERFEVMKQQIPNGTRLKMMFFMGALYGAASIQNYDLYGVFAESFVKEFPNHPKTPALQSDIQKLGTARIGSEAPDIDLPSPAGPSIKLSSLRGKYVLIDFWASWCGPCRKENPNVVKVYQKYQPKGFEIYSVSLDTDKAKWMDAIAKDNLLWPAHVSDLGGWKSVAGQAYGVSSIPFTVLLDPKGKIIAKNLRGAQLEAKLKTLLPD